MSDTFNGQGGQGVPAGIPQIPAGAQLGGEGYQQNQQAYQNQQYQQQAQNQHNVAFDGVPSSPITAGTAPQAPTNPIQPNWQPQQPHPQVSEPIQKPSFPQQPPTQPLQSNESVQSNPYNNQQPKAAETGTTYIETSINHLSAELGVSADDFDAVFENAIKHGDLSLINPHALGKELTPEQSTRVQQLAQAAVQEYQQGVQYAKNQAYSVAGGESAWNNAISAFNANAPEDVQGYAAYLADTDVEKAAKFVVQYNQSNGFVNTQNQAPITGGTGTATHGISQAEYATELAKIEREAGNRSLGSPEFAHRISALNAQRQLGRRQGR